MADIERKNGHFGNRVNLWEPCPNHATFTVYTDGELPRVLVYSSLRGWSPESLTGGLPVSILRDLIDKELRSSRILEEIGPCKRRLLQTALVSLESNPEEDILKRR